MNLVQQQETLRTLPLPVLQAKAQGQDPSVPAWLATAVLNERMSAQQKAGLAQGAAQGQQPSVAEQLEQKAGLMALQAQQQQQAQQQMMQQMAQAPQAVPQEVPQPQPQPQAPAMMASGGIARLPINPQMFNYKEGGIIGFAQAGEIPERLPGESQEQYRQRVIALQDSQMQEEKKARQDYLSQQGENLPVNDRLAIALGLNKVPATAASRSQAPAVVAPSAPPEAGDMGARDRGLASLAKALPPPAAAPRPAPASMAAKPQQTPQAGPATPPPPQPPSEYDTSLRSAIKAAEGEQGMTPEQARARYQALTPDELKQPAGLEQLARLKQQQQQYEKNIEDRPMERLMRVLGAAGRSGMGGFGTGYLEARDTERAADAAQADYQNKVMTAVESMRRGEATNMQKALLDMVEKGDERKARAIASRITGAGAGLSAEMQGKQIASNEKINELDRKLREKLHNTPSAQRASVEENAIRDYMRQFNLSYADAYNKVKQVASGFKGEMTRDQATDNVKAFLESAQGSMYIREIQTKAKDAGQPVPDIYTIRNKLIEQEMGGSARTTVSNSPLLSAADKIVSGGK